jgi:hypothetical protein
MCRPPRPEQMRRGAGQGTPKSHSPRDHLKQHYKYILPPDLQAFLVLWAWALPFVLLMLFAGARQ